jgi:hypothetical protein
MKEKLQLHFFTASYNVTGYDKMLNKEQDLF